MNIDDLNLQPCVDEVDEFLLKFCLTHKFPALMTSSIIMARLLHLNKQVGDVDDFGKLLLTVSDGIVNKEYERTENLH
jgi:hypothetical protein